MQSANLQFAVCRLHFAVTRQFLRRLLRDETAVTSTEYIVAALALVIGTVAASKTIGNALILYLHRIYLVVTLPIP
jgi:Flp pilus assembly pilin Flp